MPSFLNTLRVEEPSKSALGQLQTQAKKSSQEATKCPGVSSAKIPDFVPKVTSKWDGMPGSSSTYNQPNRSSSQIRRHRRRRSACSAPGTSSSRASNQAKQDGAIDFSSHGASQSASAHHQSQRSSHRHTQDVEVCNVPQSPRSHSKHVSFHVDSSRPPSGTPQPPNMLSNIHSSGEAKALARPLSTSLSSYREGLGVDSRTKITTQSTNTRRDDRSKKGVPGSHNAKQGRHSSSSNISAAQLFPIQEGKTQQSHQDSERASNSVSLPSTCSSEPKNLSSAFSGRIDEILSTDESKRSLALDYINQTNTGSSGQGNPSIQVIQPDTYVSQELEKRPDSSRARLGLRASINKADVAPWEFQEVTSTKPSSNTANILLRTKSVLPKKLSLFGKGQSAPRV